jgi:hypothetical protein
VNNSPPDIYWGDAADNTPPVLPPAAVTMAVSILPDSISAMGPAATVQAVAQTAGLYRLVGNLVLAIIATCMLVVAAFVVVYAPDGRENLARWIVIPASVISFGLGGFAAFRMKFSWRGVDINAGEGSPAGSTPPLGGRAAGRTDETGRKTGFFDRLSRR